jgi:hypothetical protein
MIERTVEVSPLLGHASRGGGVIMTHRIYLAAVRFVDGPPQRSDLPAERVFIHAADVAEIWVETESQSVPDAGRAVSFALGRPLDLGFERITGTVERKIRKQVR